MLFGSRARGDSTPYSDWDVTFLTRTGTRVSVLPKGLPMDGLDCDVQTLAVPEELARRKALSIGPVGRGIARDGKLLAGEWVQPDAEGKPYMEPDRYRRFINNALVYVQEAAGWVAEACEDGENADIHSEHFVARSADVAEHLAKAMLGRCGLDADWTHDVSRLAMQVERTGHSDLAWSARWMDGFTRKHHVAAYESTDVTGFHHAARRLPIVIQ